MSNPQFNSGFTGQQVESAIEKALVLDTFEHQSDEVIDGSVFHVLWKVKPTTSNQVNGFAVNPKNGKIVDICSINGVITSYRYISEADTISTDEIDNLFK